MSRPLRSANHRRKMRALKQRCYPHKLVQDAVRTRHGYRAKWVTYKTPPSQSLFSRNELWLD